MSNKKKLHWNDLSRGQQVGIVALGSLQLSLAVSAWADLIFRPASQVSGRKAKWAVVIAINFVGPALYFLRGIRR
jgi:hypothetical protein